MTVTHTIEGVEVQELARRFGTPLYVYSRRVLEERIALLRTYFPLIRYAQKANPHLAILRLMHKHGILVDAVSAGEIRRAFRAGYQARDVVYTADVFDQATLGLVREYPIPVNCGSPDMIAQYASVRPGGSVILRVNPGFGHGHSRKTDTGGPGSKHGIWHEDLEAAVRMAHQHGLRVRGLHMHIGSGTNFKHLAKVAHAMEACCNLAEIELISAGGGLPVPYRPEEEEIDLAHYRAVWEVHRQRISAKLGRSVDLEIEPGRYLVCDAGWLVARIWAIKRTSAFTFYLVDTGFHHLVRPVMYGAYHPISICPADGRLLNDTQPVAIAGPLCESGDVFTQEEGGVVVTRELPVAAVGDYLVLHKAGAYGKAMASNYNSHPYPAEVWIDQGTTELITPRQRLDEVIGKEQIPEALLECPQGQV